MSKPAAHAGAFTPLGTDFALNRMGYGAIQLTGPQAMGPPRDRKAAVAVLREAIALGINHIDTSDYYGPHVANEIIHEALHPYPTGLVIATKVGARRGRDGSWPAALKPAELTEAIHGNLQRLGLDSLDIVTLRVGDGLGTNQASIAHPLATLVQLQEQGLIRHIGLSNVSRKQFLEGDAIARIVCVQNHYNLAHRHDDALIDELAGRKIAFVPFFPLGGFRPLQSSRLDAAAVEVGATPRQVALAWLLHRAPNVLIIAGTSSVEHLRQNIAAASLKLSPAVLAKLDAIAARSRKSA